MLIIASNIDITQYLDDDFVVDFEEEEVNFLNARRSAEPEIENESKWFIELVF